MKRKVNSWLSVVLNLFLKMSVRNNFFYSKISNRKMTTSHSYLIFCLIICSILFNACTNRSSGCLDFTATNFDVSADRACSDCCTYPTLSLSFRHRIILPENQDTLNFLYNTDYPSPLDTNHIFNIERIRYFVSNLEFVKASGEVIGVTDTIQLQLTTGESKTVEDNFTKVDRDYFGENSIGTFLGSGVFDSLRFVVGLPTELLLIDTASIAETHSLYPDAESFIYNDADKYISNYIVFNRDTFPGTDSTIVKIFQPVDVSLALSNLLSPPVEFMEGFDVALTLQIDYLSWFENIDFDNLTVGDARTKIVENIANSFSIFEIEQE